MATPQDGNPALADMRGKVCLITGGTGGIGKETALGLARLGAVVVIVGRDVARAQAAVADIKARSGNDVVSAMIADLSSQAEVRRLAREFMAAHDRLDVLVNNAGAVYGKRVLTVDGIEMTLAVNHLAYFLLTNLLLPLLKRSAPARIVSVSSEAQRAGRIDFDDLQRARRYRAFEAYSQSKLANVVWTYELARRIEGSGVTANCVHPGAVATGFGRNNSGLWRVLFRVLAPFMRTPERGAATSIYLAASPEIEGISGKYFSDRKPIRSNKQSYDPELARRLWLASEELTAGGVKDVTM